MKYFFTFLCRFVACGYMLFEVGSWKTEVADHEVVTR